MPLSPLILAVSSASLLSARSASSFRNLFSSAQRRVSSTVVPLLPASLAPLSPSPISTSAVLINVSPAPSRASAASFSSSSSSDNTLIASTATTPAATTTIAAPTTSAGALSPLANTSPTVTIPASSSAAVVDGMPRYANLSAPGLLRLSDWTGTALFAFTGAITAASTQMDILGTIVVGTITAVGGGTLRDTLVLSRLPFWIEEWEYLIISLLASLAAFFAWPSLKSMGADDNSLPFLWGDAIALGAFAVIGTQNGIRARLPLGVILLCGMMTATFGGLTRDVLCQRPPRILHAHADIYASTALAGSTAYLLCRFARLPLSVRIVAGVATTSIMRMLAWTYGLRLPTWDGEGRIKA